MQERPSALQGAKLSRKAKKKLKAERLAREAGEGRVRSPWEAAAAAGGMTNTDHHQHQGGAPPRQVFAGGKGQWKGTKGKKGKGSKSKGKRR